VKKFLAIEKTTRYESGWNDEDFYKACKAAYINRYPKFGNPDDIHQCVNYLRDKAKYKMFIDSLEDSSSQASGKKPRSSRPIGSKDAKQREADKKLVASMIAKKNGETNAEGSDENGGNSGGENKNAFLQKLGAAVESITSVLCEKMKKEEEKDFVASLETPDRREWKREHAKLRLAELKAKRRKLDLEEINQNPPSSVGITNGGSTMEESSSSELSSTN
jgi:hypothetical protein